MLSLDSMIWILLSTSTTTLRPCHSLYLESCSYSLVISLLIWVLRRIRLVFSWMLFRRKLLWIQFWHALFQVYSIALLVSESRRLRSLISLLEWMGWSADMSVFAHVVTMYKVGQRCLLVPLVLCCRSFSEEQWESLILMIQWTLFQLMESVDSGVLWRLEFSTMMRASYSQVKALFLAFN